MSRVIDSAASHRISLECQCIGDGTPPVVFFNGFRMRFNSWSAVYANLELENSVVLFNRRGVGASAKASEEQDGLTVIGEIRALLSSLNMSPPYVFVAHSLGGIYANLYARTYPDEVAGMVFVDAPHPEEVVEQRENAPPFVVNFINEGVKALEKLFDKLKYSEDENIVKTIEQIAAAGHFPDIPVAVLSGTRKMPFVPEKSFRLHQHYQDELMKLSTKSTRYICNKSGHFPQITEPERVVEAIQETVGKVASER